MCERRKSLPLQYTRWTSITILQVVNLLPAINSVPDVMCPTVSQKVSHDVFVVTYQIFSDFLNSFTDALAINFKICNELKIQVNGRLQNISKGGNNIF